MSSAAALVGVFGYGAYAPAKYAVRGLMETLHAEYSAPRHLRACVFPPDTLTPGFEAENLIKPPETVAVSAGIKPKTAEAVAAALVRGHRAGPPADHRRGHRPRALGARRRADDRDRRAADGGGPAQGDQGFLDCALVSRTFPRLPDALESHPWPSTSTPSTR